MIIINIVILWFFYAVLLSYNVSRTLIVSCVRLLRRQNLNVWSLQAHCYKAVWYVQDDWMQIVIVCITRSGILHVQSIHHCSNVADSLMSLLHTSDSRNLLPTSQHDYSANTYTDFRNYKQVRMYYRSGTGGRYLRKAKNKRRQMLRMFAQQVAEVVCMKWRYCRHIESVTSNRKSA